MVSSNGEHPKTALMGQQPLKSKGIGLPLQRDPTKARLLLLQFPGLAQKPDGSVAVSWHTGTATFLPSCGEAEVPGPHFLGEGGRTQPAACSQDHLHEQGCSSSRRAFCPKSPQRPDILPPACPPGLPHNLRQRFSLCPSSLYT